MYFACVLIAQAARCKILVFWRCRNLRDCRICTLETMNSQQCPNFQSPLMLCTCKWVHLLFTAITTISQRSSVGAIRILPAEPAVSAWQANLVSLEWSLLSVLQNNKISTITDETFCKGNTSYYIRTNLHQVRLDGNPIQLSKHPNSFICLETLPIGWYNWSDQSMHLSEVNLGAEVLLKTDSKNNKYKIEFLS